MANSPGIDARNLNAFNAALAQYTKYNQRELGPLVENRANRMRWELYRLFRDIAPDRAKLDSELDALGGRVRRREINGRRLTLAQEKRKRRSSIKYLSIGFMLRAWRAQREGQNIKRDQRDRTNRKIGEVIDRTSKGVRRPSVEITNLLEGAAKQNAQRGLVNRALANQTADMKKYIVRKQQQEQARTIAKLNQFTKGISA
jgi:hypothetical protein